MGAVIWACLPLEGGAASSGIPGPPPNAAACYYLNGNQTPICGNGILEKGEACDDGNQNSESCSYGQTTCTVCAADCTLQPGSISVCGDGDRDSLNGEACDDGNTVGDDGCSEICLIDTTCGNLGLEGDEQCECQDKTVGCPIGWSDHNTDACSKTATSCTQCRCE